MAAKAWLEADSMKITRQQVDTKPAMIRSNQHIDKPDTYNILNRKSPGRPINKIRPFALVNVNFLKNDILIKNIHNLPSSGNIIS
jgi:hypothetical protein